MTDLDQPQPIPGKGVEQPRRLVGLPAPAADGTPRDWESVDELLEDWQITPPADLGNAKRFARDHRGRLSFCPQLGRWYQYDGTVWRPDPPKKPVHAMRAAQATVRSIYAEGKLVRRQINNPNLSAEAAQRKNPNHETLVN